MKKIIISNYDSISNPYYGGGGAIAIHEVAKRMFTTFEVVVIVGKYPGSKDKKIDGVKYIHTGLSFGGPKLGQIVFQFALIARVLFSKYDVWVENFTPPFSTSFLPLFTKKPVIGLVHMLSGEDMKRKYILPFHLIENLGLRVYKKFIVTQPEMKKTIQKINHKAEFVVIPNGVTIPKHVNRKHVRHIVYLGRVEVNQKGLDLLIESLRKVSIKNTKVTIAGSGEAKQVELLKNIVSMSGLSNITVIGKVTGKKKDNLLRSASCLVVPSRFETFSMASLEGMAYKLPIIAFNIPGLTWIKKTMGVKVRPYSIKAYAQAIDKVLKDTKFSRALGENGFKYAVGMDWEKIASKYIKTLS